MSGVAGKQRLYVQVKSIHEFRMNNCRQDNMN